MNDRLKSLLVYAAKCVTGCVTVFAIASILHYADISWALISVMLVLSADGKDSVPLAIVRIKANVVGAAVGALCLLISSNNLWIMSVGLVITLSLCYFLKLDAGIRSSLAAAIIVMLHEEGKHIWDTAIERIIAVLAGCLIGLIVTFIFHFKATSKFKISGSSQAEA
jgi:uncharacterized membrane protein YgaE (UPF0421/DUF939 family)